MNKKFYLGALALPLIMAACSSEDTLSEVQGVKNQYEGIAKVDATFTLDGAQSRLANKLGLEANDKIGMAWLGVPANDVANYGSNSLTGENGWAYQNHPLIAKSTTSLKPETSIYVGKYFIYHPYDAGTQQLKNIEFNIDEQPLTEDYNVTGAKSIYLSSELTDVTLDGDINENNKAGENCRFDIKARQLTNLVGLEAAWKNNDVLEEEISAPIIDSIMVGYKANGQITSVTGFEYAPKNFNNGYDATLDGETYWGHFNLQPANDEVAQVSRAAAEVDRIFKLKTSGVSATGFEAIKNGMIKLAAAEGGYTVEGENAKFYYNALPATAASAEISLRVLTDYGVIDYTLDMDKAAMTPDYKNGANPAYMEGFDGSQEIEGEGEEVLTAVPAEGSFMNRLFKSGKILADIDFFDAKISGMHVKNDAHLQKLLKFYILKTAAGKVENDVVLYLDEDQENEFKISKTSIALMQSINVSATSMKVKLHVCKEHGIPTVVATNNDKEGKEVPEFARVFGHDLNVYLEAQDWTWNETASKNHGMVNTIYNRGNLTVGSTNVEVIENNHFEELVNLADAKITFTAGVATLWKVDLTNNGTIDIPATAHMRVYSDVVNNVTALTGVRQGNMGIINNNGVLGAVEDQNGSINNYGKIYHKAGAKTFITTNAENEDFSKTLEEGTKIGIIEMSEADANVSVSNETNKGIITYTWSKEEPVYVSPAVVRFNYLIVEGNIEFTEIEKEIRYLEIKGADVYVTNKGMLSSLEGVIVDEDYALNITEGNKLKPSKAAYLKGYVYNGGTFTYGNDVITYFGGASEDVEKILKWSGF